MADPNSSDRRARGTATMDNQAVSSDGTDIYSTQVSRHRTLQPGDPGHKPDHLPESQDSDDELHEESRSEQATEPANITTPNMNDNPAASPQSESVAAEANETETPLQDTHSNLATPRSDGAADTANDDETVQRNASMELFDQLLDSVLEAPNSRGSEVTVDPTRPSTSSDADLGSASVASTGSGADNSSAIVITVNYMFMDVTNDPNPGRTGSLVVTLPNNAANREPRIISQFISLATRMAYSALVNSPKSKPGISVEKFESFEKLNPDEAQSETCSICYENYVDLEDVIVTKRRKLNTEVQTPTETVSSDRSDHNEADTVAEPPASSESEQKPYLCDHNEEYDHSALKLPCGHIFGRSCIAHWLKENANCPLCRLSVGDIQPNNSLSHVPISYIRFGGLGEGASAEGEQGSETERSDNNSESGSRRPGFLRRATSVIFNPSGRPNTPPAPLEAENPHRSSSPRLRNSGISPMINNISNFLRRSRRNRESDHTGASSLFTSGVASRRTPSGVQTQTSDDFSSGDFSESLRHLHGDPQREHGDEADCEDSEAPEDARD